MKRFSEQFNKAAHTVTMTKAERSDLKNRVVAYMEYHPLPATLKAKTPVQVVSEPFALWRFNTIHTRAIGSMFALLVLIVVPFAAEQTAPGDVLYPVKVKFNEEVRSTLAFTTYQQVEWETKRLERRLAEARLLASEGKLTEAIEAEVAIAVKTHSDAAQAGLAQLRANNSEEAAIAEITFASSLEVESEALANEVARQQAGGASTTAMTLAATVADARAAVTAPDINEVPYERLLARVEQETTRAYELFSSLRDDISPTEKEDVTRRLTDVERKISTAIAQQTGALDETIEIEAEADTVIDTDPEIEATTTATSSEIVVRTQSDIAAADEDEVVLDARELLRQALSDTQKLIRFMTDFTINGSVTVEELVPVTLTSEERALKVSQRLAEVERIRVVVTARNTSDEKTQFSLTQITDYLANAREALAENRFTRAELNSAEALALVLDLERTTTMNEAAVPAPVADTALEAPDTATSTATSSPALRETE